MKQVNKTGYSIEINGTAVAVSKEVYEVYETERSNNRNRQKRDKRNKLVSYHNLDTDKLSGEEILCDNTEESLSELAERKLMADKLHTVLELLDEDDYELIYHLYFLNYSERDYEKKTNMPQKTINNHRKRILLKLHKLMKNKK